MMSGRSIPEGWRSGMELFGFFLMSFALSTFFSMGGTGSGIALIPLLHLLGIDFNPAKAVGLFAGFSTTVTSTVMNIRRRVLEVRYALPLALTLPLFASLGAQLSRFADPSFVKLLFALFLVFSASMMLFFKKRARVHMTRSWVLACLGAGVGTLAGLLGVGGGNLLLPILILLGFDPKKAAVTVSFVIPFSALSSFLSYTSFVSMDWALLGVCSLGAVAGGYLGNHIMHVRLSPQQIRKGIAVLLYLLALKMFVSL